MPGRQRLSRRTQAIGAAWRQPRDIVYDPRGQPQAIGHEGLAVAIVAAPRARDVEQPASDVGFGDFTGILVFELMQAAAPAALAQRLPFGARQFAQRQEPGLLPQRTPFASSAAIRRASLREREG